MQAIMLAAGKGSRLGKYTKNNTKCMLDVHGETLLERAIDALLEAGIKDFILVLGYKKDNVKKFIKEKELDKKININKEINELDIKYKSISTNQFKLVKLIKRVLNKDTSITRDEVLSILKSVAFDEEESYVAAKLILFPERELIPYFEGFNIEFKEPTEQIIYLIAIL